jgi:hypothetical protein
MAAEHITDRQPTRLAGVPKRRQHVNTLNRIGTIAATVIIVAWSAPGAAQSTCGNIAFSSDISSRFPNARAACIDIVERDGMPYAHFKARIVRVSGNTVEAQFVAPDGTTSRIVEFTPPSTARVRIENRSYRYSELARGQELDVYLPPDRWAFAVAQDPVDFAAAPSIEAVPLREPAQQVAALPSSASRLPATAGFLPWLAALGTFLVGVGSALGVLIARRVK